MVPFKFLASWFMLQLVQGENFTSHRKLQEISNRPIHLRRFQNEQSAILGQPEPKWEEISSHNFDLIPRDIIMGVFHCQSHESGRLSSVAATWGKSVVNREFDGIRVYLLASKGGVSHGSRFPAASLLITNEVADDYKSTLPKGLLGLQGMFERNPTAKWFGVVGDDVFIDAVNLVHVLSGFDPDEEWCLVDAGTVRRKVGGSGWRIYGGAPVITSRALTKRLVPYLKSFSDHADRSIVHDIQFTMLMAAKGGGVHRITHVDGLYSQGPGVYLGCPENPTSCPKAKPSLPPRTGRWAPVAYHHITTDAYMRFLHALHHQARVCSSSVPLHRFSLSIGLPNTKRMITTTEAKYLYFDNNGQLSNLHAKQKKQFHGVATPSSGWHRGMTQVGPSQLVGSMYALHPDSDWFMILPLEAPHIQLDALHSFIGLVCDKQGRNCDCDRPRVIAVDESLQGVVLVSRGAAKLAVLSGGLHSIPGVEIRASSLLSSLVIADAVAYQKEKLSGPKSGPDDCAIVLSTHVALSGMHWGTREAPLALAQALLH